MIYLLLLLLIIATLAGVCLLLSFSAPAGETEIEPPWRRQAVAVGDQLRGAYSWLLYHCPDCKKDYGSRASLTQHIVHRDYCTVDPAIPLDQLLK